VEVMAVGVSMNMVCVVVALLAAVMTTVHADEVNICKRVGDLQDIPNGTLTNPTVPPFLIGDENAAPDHVQGG